VQVVGLDGAEHTWPVITDTGMSVVGLGSKALLEHMQDVRAAPVGLQLEAINGSPKLPVKLYFPSITSTLSVVFFPSA
jgi:hypothetical protein